MKDLLRRCPDIVELDLSDCAILTISSIHTLLNFSKLEHLSLSRCYSIPQSAYTRLAQMPPLLYLDIFGLMTDPVLKSLQDNYRKLDINKFYYSSIARPTVGIRRTSIWGQRVRDWISYFILSLVNLQLWSGPKGKLNVCNATWFHIDWVQ